MRFSTLKSPFHHKFTSPLFTILTVCLDQFVAKFMFSIFLLDIFIGNLRFSPPNLFISILEPTFKTLPGCEHRWAGCEHRWQCCEHCWRCPVGAPFHFPSFPPWLTSFTKGINRWVPPGKKNTVRDFLLKIYNSTDFLRFLALAPKLLGFFFEDVILSQATLSAQKKSYSSSTLKPKGSW